MPDPRDKANPKTTNERLLQRTVDHLYQLTRLQGGQAQKVGKDIDDDVLPAVKTELLAIISQLKGFGSSGSARKRLEPIQKKLKDKLTGVKDNLKERLVGLAEHETDFKKRLLEKEIALDVNFNKLSEDELRKIIRSHPFKVSADSANKQLATLFKDLSEQTTKRIASEIKAGIAEGESIDKIMDRLRGSSGGHFNDGVFNFTKNAAESITRTGVINTSNEVSRRMYEQNADIIKNIRIIVTFDSRTCLTCSQKDANNPYPLDNYPQPPFHLRCRCTVVPVTKSYKELGYSDADLPEATRASMDGQVPASMSYSDWLESKSESFQRQVLGDYRYTQWQGGSDLTDFVSRDGDILSLDELKSLES